MNMLTRWVPGDILVAVGDGGVLALDGSAQAMEAMWTELGEHRCLGDLLKSLSRLHDNEVFTLPDFLMMAIDGQELRVAARGRFCLHLDTADGERSFSASEVVVWEESRYERVNQCILELTPATRHPAGPEGLDEFLPLRSGIVRASQLHIGFGDHQLPLSSPAQTDAHGGQGAPQPSAAQEILQQAQADGAPSGTTHRRRHRYLRGRSRARPLTSPAPIPDRRWNRSPWARWTVQAPRRGPGRGSRPRCWDPTTFRRPRPQPRRRMDSRPRTTRPVVLLSAR